MTHRREIFLVFERRAKDTRLSGSLAASAETEPGVSAKRLDWLDLRRYP
jgi:hypothetical protein